MEIFIVKGLSLLEDECHVRIAGGKEGPSEIHPRPGILACKVFIETLKSR
ncbi:MAG: hypothetical protein MUE45_01355 [Methanoregulaceae archaeon]|jgi:hypothetical protein|nr:hypothetical protein [Methanoregulaceae archaeon]MCU0628124.1 hypothetical protein [Methanoregulaceae archaeon]